MILDKVGRGIYRGRRQKGGCALQPSNARFCGYHDDVNWLKQSSQNKPMKNRMVAGIRGGGGGEAVSCLGVDWSAGLWLLVTPLELGVC